MSSTVASRNQPDLEVVRRWVAERLDWERFLTAAREPRPERPRAATAKAA